MQYTTDSHQVNNNNDHINMILTKATTGRNRSRSRSRDRNIQYKFSAEVSQALLHPTSYQVPHVNNQSYDANQDFMNSSKIEIERLTYEIEILKKKKELFQLEESYKIFLNKNKIF
jgi:hypothetical protein